MQLETGRLLLRPISPEDLDDFATLHADPEVTRFMRSLDRAEVEERLRRDEEEWRNRGHGLLAIVDAQSGRFLGRTGLKHWPQFGETEVGWMLRRDAWGHGYATEAAGACLAWGFGTLEVPYLTAMIGPANSRSERVAKRLGFEPSREDVLLDEPVIVHVLHRPQGRGGEHPE